MSRCRASSPARALRLSAPHRAPSPSWQSKRRRSAKPNWRRPRQSALPRRRQRRHPESNGCRHVVEDQGRYSDRSDCDHRAVAGAIDVAPDRGRSRSGEGSAEPHLLENEFQRLQHPDPRHRHAGDFGDDRSGGGGRVQRHALHPQSFLRAGILRRSAGRSVARAARHALRPQRDRGRGERRFGQTDRSVSKQWHPSISAITTIAASKACSIFRSSAINSICAWPANGPSATAIRSTRRPIKAIDGRDLWSGRVSLLVHPIENLTANLVWEHFSEDDDRLRSGKQLCTTDQRAGRGRWARRAAISQLSTNYGGMHGSARAARRARFMGRQPFETPNAGAIPFIAALEYVFSCDYIATGHGSLCRRWFSRKICASSFAARTQIPGEERYVRTQCRLRHHRCADADVADRIQQGFPVFDGGLQSLQHGAGTVHDDPRCLWQRHWSDRTASFAIRNWVARPGWSARTFPRNMPGNSPRNCGWPRISAARSISAWAAISCTTRRSRIIMSSPTPSLFFTEYVNDSRFQRRQPLPDAPHVPFDPAAGECLRPASGSQSASLDDTFFGLGCAYDRSQSAEPDRRPGPQLFPQPESLSAEFLRGLRRGLLSGDAGCETDRRLALDRRPEAFRRDSKLDARRSSRAIPSPESSIRNGRNGRAASSPTGRPSSISPINRCSTVPIRAATRAAAPIRRASFRFVRPASTLLLLRPAIRRIR